MHSFLVTKYNLLGEKMKNLIIKNKFTLKIILTILLISLFTTIFEYLFLDVAIGNILLTTTVIVSSFYYSYN